MNLVKYENWSFCIDFNWIIGKVVGGSTSEKFIVTAALRDDVNAK